MKNLPKTHRITVVFSAVAALLALVGMIFAFTDAFDSVATGHSYASPTTGILPLFAFVGTVVSFLFVRSNKIRFAVVVFLNVCIAIMLSLTVLTIHSHRVFITYYCLLLPSALLNLLVALLFGLLLRPKKK